MGSSSWVDKNDREEERCQANSTNALCVATAEPPHARPMQPRGRRAERRGWGSRAAPRLNRRTPPASRRHPTLAPPEIPGECRDRAPSRRPRRRPQPRRPATPAHASPRSTMRAQIGAKTARDRAKCAMDADASRGPASPHRAEAVALNRSARLPLVRSGPEGAAPRGRGERSGAAATRRLG